MYSGTAKQTVVGHDNIGAPDVSLRAMVDACVSNVAVLNESGSIIYASQAWDLLERNVIGKTGVAPLFESCRRFRQSESNEQPEITLEEDIRSILAGRQKEFHQEYFACSRKHFSGAYLNTRKLFFRRFKCYQNCINWLWRPRHRRCYAGIEHATKCSTGCNGRCI